MEEKVLRLSDFTNLDAEFLQKTKKAVKKLNEYTRMYKNLELSGDLDGLEKLKREHSSYLSYFISFYASISAYKENHEFLQNEKKQKKSFYIEELKDLNLVKSLAEAEKVVYSYPKYQESIKQLQEIKKFFIYVDEIFAFHKNVLSRSIFQTISLISKEKQASSNS